MTESPAGHDGAHDPARPDSVDVRWSSAHGGYVASSSGQRVDRPAPDPRRQLLVRASIAVLLFAALQVGWELLRGGAFEYAVTHEGTVRPAAAFIRLLTPEVHAQAVRFSVKAPGGGLNIRNGCEGTEALFLLVAAFLVAPLRWRSRVLGLVTGVACLFVVNQVRVVTLFYAWRADPALFEVLHGTVAPMAMVLLVGGFFHVWLDVAGRTAISGNPRRGAVGRRGGHVALGGECLRPPDRCASASRGAQRDADVR